jgi:hypothetical protein
MGSMTLFACGGGSSSGTGTGSSAGLALTKLDLIGSWVGCVGAEGFSVELDVTFNEGSSAASIATSVGNTICIKADLISQETSTDSFELGALLPNKTVTVDGVDITLTNVTEINLTNTTAGAAEFGQVEFNIIGVQDGAKLFIGDIRGEQTGDTEALRPTTLANVVYVKTVVF